MYCNRCGASLVSGEQVCRSCGASQPMVIGPTQAVTVSPERLAWHVHLLAIFWFIVAALWCIPAVVLFVVGTVAGAVVPAHTPEQHMARVFAPFVLYIIGCFVGAIGGLCFAAAWGLLHLRPWARMLAIVLGVISLIHPPFGTALGIYTLWVLLPGDAGAQYERMTVAHA